MRNWRGLFVFFVLAVVLTAVSSAVFADPVPVGTPHGTGTLYKEITDPRVIQLNDDDAYDEYGNKILSENYFTANMPIASIWIDETVVKMESYKLGSDKVEATLLYTGPRGGLNIYQNAGDDYGRLYFDFSQGSLTYGSNHQDDYWEGPIVEYKIKDAGEWVNPFTQKEEKVDLVITYSDLHISLQQNLGDGNGCSYRNNPANLYNLFDRLTILDTNQVNPKLYTTQTINSIRECNPRVGTKFDVNVKVVKKNGKLVDGSFYFPMVDLDIRRGDKYKTLYQATTQENDNYSEHVELLSNYGMPTSGAEWDEKIWIPGGDYNSVESAAWYTNMPYLSHIYSSSEGKLIVTPGNPEAYGKYDGKNGSLYIISQDGPGRDEDFYTGFATLANNSAGGINFRLWSTTSNDASTGGSGTATSFIMYGSKPVNHKAAASSDEGGTIFTTTTGNADGKLTGGDLLGTDEINSPYRISVATGQSVTYTMTPKLGYRIKNVWVKPDDINVIQEKIDQYKIPNCADDQNGGNCYEYQPDDGTYTYTFSKITQDKSIHVEWEKSGLTVTKEVIESRKADDFDFRIQITPPDGYENVMNTYRAMAWLSNQTGTATQYTFESQYDRQFYPACNNDPDGCYDGEYLIYDQVNYCFVGWDADNQTWIQKHISNPAKPVNNLFKDEEELSRFLWKTISDSNNNRLIYNKSVGYPEGSDQGTPLIRSNAYPYEIEMSIGEKTTNSEYVQPVKQYTYTNSKLSFYWNEAENRYEWRSTESTSTTGPQYKEVIFYSYSTDTVTVDLDTEYINLKDYDDRFEPIAGGGSSYMIQLPKTEKYDTAQLEYLLHSHDVNFDGCEVIPVSDTTVLDDLIAAWNRANPTQRLSKKDEDNNIYQFTLSYNGTDFPSINLQAIVPFGWNYRIWEVDKNGLEVTSENPVFSTTSGEKWEYLGSVPKNTGLTEMNPLSDVTPAITFKNGEPVSIAVHKIWDDENNRDGAQPTRVFFYVENDNTGKWAAQSFVTAADKEPETNETWTIVFEDLPKYVDYAADPSELIKYSVHEFYLPELSRYTIVKSPDGKNGVERDDPGSHYKYFDVTNKYVPEKIEIPVYKTWDDAGNRDGKRPQSVTVYIKQSSETNPAERYVMDPNNPTQKLQLELNANNDWQGRFTDLYKYDPVKKEISYTLEEDQTGLSDYNQPGGAPQINAIIAGNQSAGYIITNSYIPEKRELTVIKTWEGNDGNNRPSMSDYLAKLSVSVDSASTKYFFENLNLVTGTTNQYTASLNGTPVSIVTVQNNDSWTITIKGLPKNKYSEVDGSKPIDYVVNEEPIPGYCGETGDRNNMDNGFSFTNKWNLIDITVTKTWKDTGHENMRPNTIKIYLSGSDGSLRAYDLPKNESQHVFDNLPAYTLSGSTCTPIIYQTYEEKITNYNESVNDYDITNTYSEINTLNIHVTKSWDDDNNRDRVRPQSVTVELLRGESAAATGITLELNESNGWSGIFRNLPIKDGSGADIKYDVLEQAVDGYSVVVTKNTDMSGVSIKNTRSIDTVTLTMTKQWDDENDRYEERLTDPQKLLERLKLIGDGTEYTLVNPTRDGTGTNPYRYNASVYGHAVTVEVTMSTAKSADPWTVKISGLPKNKNGQAISWDLNENPDKYIFTKTTPVKGNDGNFTVSGKNFLNWTQVQLTKTWIDGGSSTRDPLKFLNGLELYANRQYYYHGTYTLETHPDAYTWTFSASAHPDLIVTIVDNQDNTWTVTVDKLPREINGQKVTWTVQEKMEGYDSVINGFDITNVQKTDVTVTKIWDDENNRDGKRQTANVSLLADGVLTGKIAVVPVTDGWSYTFSELPKYKLDNSTGQYRLINYTVSETAIGGYTAAISPVDNAYNYTITNMHTPETVAITVNKTWDDDNNRDGLRRETTVRLLADGVQVDEKTVTITGNTWQHIFRGKPKYQQGAVGGEIHYTVEEDPVSGYTTTFTQSGNTWSFINKHVPETVDIKVTKIWADSENQDGLRPTEITVNLYKGSEPQANIVNSAALSGQNAWSYTFAGLPAYENEQKITYLVDEADFNCFGTQTNCLTGNAESGYLKSIQASQDSKSFTIINTHTPETVTVQGTKTWAGVPSGQNPPSDFTIILWADGKPIDSQTFASTGTKIDWSFPDLPKKENGQNIQYTITERAIDDYTRDVPVSGTRNPDSADYESLNFNITNTYDTDNLSLRVTKIWDDDNDRDGLRPGTISVSLKVNNNVATDSYGQPCTYTLSSSENWTHLFTVPSHDAAGNPLTYTAVESDFNCKGTNNSCMTGNANTGYIQQTMEGGMNEGYFRFTNTHTPAVIDIPVTKVWDDDGNRDGFRPGSVTFVVTRTNDSTSVGAVTLSGSQTTGQFTGLYKYCGNGTLCSYSITEPQVPDRYTMTASGCTGIAENSSCEIKNSRTPETVQIKVTKDWDDANNQDGIRPSDITVTLYKGTVAPANVVKDTNGDPVTVTLNAANGWAASFPAQLAKENGQAIVYAVDESNFSCPRVGDNCLGTDTGYQKVSVTGSAANGFVITNKHNPEKITVRGTKKWLGVPAGYVLPDSITIELRVGNTPKAHTVGRKTNNPAYSWSFTNLDKYENGALINYVVAEYDIPGFIKDVPTTGTRSADGKEITFDIKNTYDPDKTQVRVSKVWDDDNNRDNLRPRSITVMLYSDNGVAGSTPTPVMDENGLKKTLTLSGDSWSDFFTDLPSHNENGDEINYTVDEETFNCNGDQNCLGTDDAAAASGYQKVSIVKTEAGGYIITNKHVPETVDITVTKEWDDEENQDGIRPNSVSFVLKRTNTDSSVTVVDAVTLSGNTTEHTFSGLPKYCGGGNACKYTVDEPQVPQGYQMDNKSCVDITNGGSCTIKNSHTPETIRIPVTKVWNDNDNVDNKRPDEVTVKIIADGDSKNPVDTFKLDDDSTPEWYGVSKALPKYRNAGTRIDYTIVEDSVLDYTYVISGTASRPEDGYTVTNTYNVLTQPLTIRKTWVYGDALPSSRLTVRQFLSHITIDIDGGKYYLTNVRDNASGGYTAVVNGTPVTITVTGADSAKWTITIDGLPKNRWDEGQGKTVPIGYNIAEDPITNYYTETGANNSVANGFDITNKYNVTSRTITKIWDDNNNGHNNRPSSVTVHLHGTEDGSLREVEITPPADNPTANTWTYTFTNLPKYDSNGVEITYYSHEVNVDHYISTVSNNKLTITNTWTDTRQININVIKIWDDDDNRDGERPGSVTFRLWIGNDEQQSITVTGPTWTGVFGPLRYADESGTPINYSVTEDAVNGYTARSGDPQGSYLTGLNFQNSRTTEKVKLTMTKDWDDNNNMYKLRGDQPTKLLQRLRVIVGSVEYSLENLTPVSVSASPYTFTAIVQGFPVDITVTGDVDKGDRWTVEITGLPKYKNGQVLSYDITENPDTYSFTGTKTGDYTFTGENFLNMQRGVLTKVWADESNKDGKRPTDPMKMLESLRLYANGEYYHHGAFTLKEHTDESKVWTYTIAAHPNVLVTVEDTNENKWIVTVDKLPRILNNKEVVWTVTEDMEGYTSVIDGMTVTNVPEIGVKVKKVWNDASNQDGYRKDVTLNLWWNNTENGTAEILRTVTVPASFGDSWEYTFSGLQKYKDNSLTNLIEYTVTETLPAEMASYYTQSVAQPTETEEAWVITNTHAIDTVNFKICKVWEDENDQDGLRSTAAAAKKMRLLADGNVVAEGEFEVPTEDRCLTLSGLPKFQAGSHGRLIHYAAVEDTLTGYSTTLAESDVTEADDSYGEDPVEIKYHQFKFTNKHTPVTVNVPVGKVWDDNNDQDGLRSKVIATVQLYANGAVVSDKKLQVEPADGWSGEFTGLPKYAEGKAIDYTVQETIVYDSSVTGTPYTWVVTGDMTKGFTITNSLTPSVRDVTITKVWDDGNNQDGLRDNVIFYLYQNGNLYRSVTSDSIDSPWTYTWKDLPTNCGGSACVYTVDEPMVPRPYTKSVDQSTLTVTNSYTPATVTVEGKKTWDDNDNRAGKRPDSIIITLKADGEMYKSDSVTNPKTIKADSREDGENAWSWKWEGLPKYKNVDNKGVEIVWSVAETAVPDSDYTTTYPSGYNVTNTYSEGYTSVTVQKVWDDDKNRDGARPSYIYVDLYADGKKTEQSKALADANKWQNTFTNLPIYREGATGEEIVYTVKETDSVPGYTTLAPVFDADAKIWILTNTHELETTTVQGHKTWVHRALDPNPPTSITVHLYADGVIMAGKDKTITESSMEDGTNPWSWKWEGLPKYKEGEVKKEIVYTVRETPITGYTMTIDSPNVTNTYSPYKTFLSIRKAWNDGNNQDDLRPGHVEIVLLSKVGSGPYTETNQKAFLVPDAATPNLWRVHTFENLDRYTKDGLPITYSVKEIGEIRGYSISDPVLDPDSGVYVITNTHTPETISITGEKVWDNATDPKKPESVTIHLLANGKEVSDSSITVTKETKMVDGKAWTWKWEGLPKFANGQEITYTVSEDTLEDYTLTVQRTPAADGNSISFVLTNKYDPGMITIRVQKVWEDNDDQDGIRPKTVEVKLIADGNTERPVATATLPEEGTWRTRFNVREYDGTRKIVYTVAETFTSVLTEETDGPGTYMQETITGDVENGFVITNVHTPEKISITGTKTWLGDADVPTGTRPDHITLELLADGSRIATTVGEQSNNYAWAFNNLDKYANGNEIEYVVAEFDVPGYERKVMRLTKNDVGMTYSVTNTYSPRYITLNVTKRWDDNNNQDGYRPASITVNLFKGEGESRAQVLDSNNQPVTLTLNDAGRWTGTFEHLPKYENGVEIIYTVDEAEFSHSAKYIKTITGDMAQGYIITNTHEPEIVYIHGTKSWSGDDDNIGGTRPEYVVFELLANGVSKVAAVAQPPDYVWSFPLQPRFSNGHKITYTVYEYPVTGYDVSSQNMILDDEQSYDFTNTYNPGMVSLTVKKVWSDAEDQDGIRENSVLVKLLADGKPTERNYVLNEGNSWTYTFTNLEAMKDGVPIVYSVEEEKIGAVTGTDGPQSYAISYEKETDKENSWIVKNTHTPESINISVEKIWDDNADKDEVRPSSVTVHLLADGAEVGSKEIRQTDNWKWIFENQPKYSNGTLIQYSIEEDGCEGYTAHFSGDAYTGFKVTNRRAPNETSVTVRKVWEDQNNNDGKRPAGVTVNLLADGERVDSVILTGSNKWEHTFEGLQEYKDAAMTQRITYSVEEIETEGYVTEVSGNADSGFVVTNTHKAETFDIPVTKVWDDADNQDGKRPKYVTIRLFADGAEVRSITLTADNDWKYTFTNLPVYQNGKEIDYTLTEGSMDDYTASIIGTASVGFTVTNSYEIGKTSLSVIKRWEDADNQDGIRPEEVTVTLLANGEPTDQVVKLNAENSWSHEFGSLDEYKNGVKIAYSVSEESVNGYTTTIEGDAVDGFIIVNAHTPEKIDVHGVKVWNDNDNAASARPDDIIIRLHSNETEITSQSVHADEQGNWEWVFKGLPKYADGREIRYTITEETPEQYAVEITGDAKEGFVITNTYAKNKTSLSVSKHWTDAYDNDDIRPKSVEVKVLADYGDGNGYVPTNYSGVITGPDWELIINDLPMTVDGVPVKYTVSEENVPGYTAVIEGDQDMGYMITNVHKPETVTVSGQKIWNDNNDSAQARPKDIIVHLRSDGAILRDVRVSAADDWKWSFSDLPKYQNGRKIVYTVQEEPVDNYTPEISADGFSITNNFTSGKRSLPVDVEWIDQNDADGFRPGSVTIKLYADGVDTGKTLILDESNDWKGSFTDLAICSANPKGLVSKAPNYEDICAAEGTKHVIYTVQEVHTKVITGENTETTYSDEYEGSSNEGWTVKNRHTPVVIIVFGSKTWSGNGPIPESITVRLLANNEEIDHRDINETDNWSWTFGGLPKYKNGTKVDYSISEDRVKGYTPDVNGYNITNRYTPKLRSLTIRKTWDDNDNAAGMRPENVTVRILLNGTQLSTVVLNENNSWYKQIDNLPISDASGDILYTVEETEVPTGYTSRIAGDMNQGYRIINTYKPDLTSIEVRKVWSGIGEKPGSVTIHLRADGRDTGQTLVLTADTGKAWVGSFDDLPVHDPVTGAVIEYSVSESPVPEGYDCDISGSAAEGFTVTNTKQDVPPVPPVPPFFPIEGELPKTGITNASASRSLNRLMSVSYQPMSMDLLIPGLNVESSIVMIEPVDGVYPVELLGNDSGLLAGTARPGEGLSVIAAHNTLDADEYGPFALISTLEKGDRFFVRDEEGEMLIFEVYANEKIGSHDAAALYQAASQYSNTITLLTCEDERPEGGYAARRIVTARMINGN